MEDARAVVVLLLQSDIQPRGLAGVSGTELIPSHRGSSDLFLLPLRRVSMLLLTLVGTKQGSALVLCFERWVFPTFPGFFGLQQEITGKHLRTRAFSQKITRAWHHSRSLVHAEEPAHRLPQELCFS